MLIYYYYDYDYDGGDDDDYYQDDAHPIVSNHKPELERPKASGERDSPMLNRRFIIHHLYKSALKLGQI